ncbi:small multi-drug export protein [Candidatus Woesearchaeota archaeon]|jgi:uncharacterized membrane protein|nr:small multi-drug export protein [Candidatus Woesearchaeota archaeon]
MQELIYLIGLTLTPFLELRASIPYGVFATNFSLLSIFLICVITNILLAPIIYFFYDKIIHIFLKINVINKCYQKIVTRTQKKVHKYVEKYGILGLAVFIGIPLPGSGVYSGALAAHLLGFRKRDFFLAATIGVLIAGVIVLLVSTAGNGAWNILIKKI